MKSIAEYTFTTHERRAINRTPTIQICRALDTLFPAQVLAPPDEAAFTDVDGQPWLSVKRLDHADTQYTIALDLPAPPKIEPIKSGLRVRNKATFVYDLDLVGQGSVPAERFTHLGRVFGPIRPGERWQDPTLQQLSPTLAVRGIAFVLSNFAATRKRNADGTPVYA